MTAQEVKPAFGVKAGDNNFKSLKCPFCGSTGDHFHAADDGARVMWFSFRDYLSAKEYTISGLCQKCQDGVFKA